MAEYILMIEVLIMCLVTLITPIVLTILNIINLFKKKKIKPKLIDNATFILGIFLTILLYVQYGFKDYQTPLRLGGGLDTGFHAPLASWSLPTVLTICIVGIISYLLIRDKELDLPPLIVVISMSGILLSTLFYIFFIIQCAKNLGNWINGYFYLIIFPINYILCSIRAEIEIIKVYKEKQKNLEEYNNKFLKKCNNILMKIDVEKWPIIAIVAAIPLAIVLIIILVLLGQRPDEIVKAFTETSDWTLSQQYSPPPVYYDAHYLCTVSLKGHKDLVKPLRYGIRRNQKIVVNRQLCVANAFEQLIQERTPRFHHFIRYIYDKYGYPLSKHINTPFQADVTYILMKPLEYIFVIVLYLFDKNPENRIAMQYLPKIR